jgi:tetratricopeptide (TPR) repeat protein
MRHLSEDEIARVMTQAASASEASSALAHLFSCLQCLVQAERIMKGRGSSGKAAALLSRYLDLQQENVVEFLLADAQWSEMRGLNAKAQKDRIASNAKCRTTTFVQLLLGDLKSASSWRDAERLASLISASINAMDPKEYPSEVKNDLRAEISIELANSRRRSAEWARADEALMNADSFLVKGSGSRTLRGRRLSVSASLEADRGNLNLALSQLDEAKSIYDELGETRFVARTLLQAANALAEPDPVRGLILLDEADPIFPLGDPLLLNARICRIDCLIWTGQYREAITHLTICERPNRGRMQIRFRFIGARLLHSLGYKKDAERVFQDVVTEDLEGALFKDALLDMLYLIKVHLSEGELPKAIGVCRRALGDASFAHDQLKSVWKQILEALEERSFVPEAFPPLKQYMSMHWKHPAMQPPSFLGRETTGVPLFS